jgi:hypothetical protein
MKRVALNLFFGVAITAAVLQAQNRLSEDAKEACQPIKLNILNAAEQMPDSEYGFKPTPELRRFGQLIAHVAEAQIAICGVAKGAPPKRGDSPSKTAKADLIAVLKASNEFCDGVHNTMTDQDGAEIVKSPVQGKSRSLVCGTSTCSSVGCFGSRSQPAQVLRRPVRRRRRCSDQCWLAHSTTRFDPPACPRGAHGTAIIATVLLGARRLDTSNRRS